MSCAPDSIRYTPGRLNVASVRPVDAAISYYESLALPWERAAFIRARAAAGDLALGKRLELVVIDGFSVAAYLVADDAVQLAREVELVPMRQVAAVRKIEP